jgi:hypothetical protein
MRRKTKNSNKIISLTIMLGVLLGLLNAPTIASAGVYNNVTILHLEPLNDGSYSYRLRLFLDNREETLLLNQSEAFSDTTVFSVSGTGATQSGLQDLAVYQGQIENVADSWARLVIQGDTVTGIIDADDERMHINQIDLAQGVRQIKSGFNLPLGQPLAAPLSPGDELVDDENEIGDIVEIDIGSGFFNKPEKVTKVASIAIVVDSAYDEAIGGRGLAQAISTINAVDGIYREEFGLALKVETALMVTDAETLAMGDISLEDNLTRFRDYRLLADQISNDLALVHLFTGVFTADPSVGLAYIDTVCRTNGYDVSLSLPFRYPILLTAHEIGHNLGALHDDETTQCNNVSDGLMFSHINENSTRMFSACSVDAISKRLEESTCHADAIDMDVTLARQDDTGIIALITNTDTIRAFPGAYLSMDLEHATIASVPPGCDVLSDTSAYCTIATTFAEESQSLAFDLRFNDDAEIKISARLDADGFVDVHSANNTAEIVIPQVILTTQNDPATDEENVGTADASSGDSEGGNAGASGGGTSGIEWFAALLALFAHGLRRYVQISPATRSRYPGSRNLAL